MAGIIAAKNNGIGVTGVAYNATIMPISVADSQGSLTGNLANAIRYAVDNGARVINMSLSSYSDSPQLRDALAYAASRNVITVSAAGNDGAPTPTLPASYATQYGISVGSLYGYSTLAGYSNLAGNDSRMRYVVAPDFGNFIDQRASIGYYASGTSMAAAYVSGVVALMLSANPNLTHAQVRDILTSSTNSYPLI